MTPAELEICKQIWPKVPWVPGYGDFRITAELRSNYNFVVCFIVWKLQSASNFCFVISLEHYDGTNGTDLFSGSHADLAVLLETGRTEYLQIVEEMAGLASTVASDTPPH